MSQGPHTRSRFFARAFASTSAATLLNVGRLPGAHATSAAGSCSGSQGGAAPSPPRPMKARTPLGRACCSDGVRRHQRLRGQRTRGVASERAAQLAGTAKVKGGAATATAHAGTPRCCCQCGRVTRGNGGRLGARPSRRSLLGRWSLRAPQLSKPRGSAQAGARRSCSWQRCGRHSELA